MPLLHDRAGRFSPLLALTLLGLLAPAAWLAVRALHGDFSGGAALPGVPPGFGDAAGAPAAPFGGAAPSAFGGEQARPITGAIHFTGDWAIRFLLLSLAVTPFRKLLHWPRLVLVRRRIGLAALAYAVLHLALYAADQDFVLTKIVSEIALRIYLAIGFVALIGLVALGATSTDGAVKRMGARNWSRLHKLAYPIAGLALLHFTMQSKLDISDPAWMWGLFLWAMGWRILQNRGDRATSPVWLVWLAVAAALATAFSEAAWYGLATGVDPARVLAANFSVRLGLRPCWIVLLFGLAAAASSFVGAWRRGPTRPRAERAARLAPADRAA